MRHITRRSVLSTLGAVFLVAWILSLFALHTPKAESSPSDNLSGFAWSETIGWISMNSTNDGSTNSYGVNVASDGTISGYAWSDNIGWVSFNETTGCPAGACRPNFNKTTGEVTGWVRALSAPAAGANAGGWDGWISLSCSNTGSCPISNYKVSVSGCSWSGWAWGSDVVGWVNFGGDGGTVIGTGDACGGPALTLSASPISINAGNSSTIQWTVTGTADSCWASGGWTGWKTFSGTDNEIVSPLITTTYNLECWDSGVSSGQKSVTVNVVPYACTSIPANTTMCPNDDSGLTGNTGATLIATPSSCTIPTACEYYCSIGFKNQGSTCIPTQCNDGIDNDGDTFTDGGDPGCTSIADDNETNVVGAPTISANPRYVEVGQQTTLTWDTNGNSGCTLTANDTIVPAVDPNLVTMHNPSINARTTYTLICPPYDPASVMVEVVPRQFES